MFSIINQILTTCALLRANKSGVTAIEYGLIMGATALGIVISVQAAGIEIGSVFTTLSGVMTTISQSG
ncbi:MAG: Flp family type IVb pilin [Rhodospirillales bacterium]|nr:Flp family type IVb pilin [Rhodospirillales bacterium]